MVQGSVNAEESFVVIEGLGCRGIVLKPKYGSEGAEFFVDGGRERLCVTVDE